MKQIPVQNQKTSLRLSSFLSLLRNVYFVHSGGKTSLPWVRGLWKEPEVKWFLIVVVMASSHLYSPGEETSLKIWERLAYELFTFGFRTLLKNVACFMSLLLCWEFDVTIHQAAFQLSFMCIFKKNSTHQRRSISCSPKIPRSLSDSYLAGGGVGE